MNRGAKITIAILVVLLLGVAGFGGWYIFLRDTTPEVLPPDYAPVAEDPNAESTGSEGTKNPSSEGGGSVTLQYQADVTADLSDGSIKFSYENPYASTHDVVLQIIVTPKKGGEYLIGESGTLKPGNKLTKLSLQNANLLSAGTYEGRFNVLFYDVETGERAVVNTNIPVQIKVKD